MESVEMITLTAKDAKARKENINADRNGL